MAYHFLSLNSTEVAPSRQKTHAQVDTGHPHPTDHKLPTCSFDYFPNSTGSGRYERMLIKAQSSNIDNMKSIYIFFRGNSIAYCSLIYMAWKVNIVGLILQMLFIWRSGIWNLKTYSKITYDWASKGVKSLLSSFYCHQNSKSECSWLMTVISYCKSIFNCRAKSGWTDEREKVRR